MDESPRYNFEGKKPDTKEYRLYNSMYNSMIFKTRCDQSSGYPGGGFSLGGDSRELAPGVGRVILI